MPCFSATNIHIPHSVKSKTADNIVVMCATDIRLFSIVDDGHCFGNTAEELIAVSAVPVADVLPCSTTVSTTVSMNPETVVAARKEVIREKLLVALQLADGHTLGNHRYITTARFIDTD